MSNLQNYTELDIALASANSIVFLSYQSFTRKLTDDEERAIGVWYTLHSIVAKNVILKEIQR